MLPTRPAPAQAPAAGAVAWSAGRRLTREVLRATALAYLVGVGLLLSWAVLLPTALGWRATVVVSGSMEPAVHVGDVLLFDKEDPATLKAGRIILFDDPNRPGQLISHRLYGSGPDGTLITKGDANASTDSSPLQAAHLRGAARMVLPRIGLLAVWRYRGTVTSRLWLVVTVLAGCVVIALPRHLETVPPLQGIRTALRTSGGGSSTRARAWRVATTILLIFEPGRRRATQTQPRWERSLARDG